MWLTSNLPLPRSPSALLTDHLPTRRLQRPTCVFYEAFIETARARPCAPSLHTGLAALGPGAPGLAAGQPWPLEGCPGPWLRCSELKKIALRVRPILFWGGLVPGRGDTAHTHEVQSLFLNSLPIFCLSAASDCVSCDLGLRHTSSDLVSIFYVYLSYQALNHYYVVQR